MLLDLALAAIPFTLGLAVTWRLIWPRWKVVGKTIAYFGVVALLSRWVGHWSVLVATGHQVLGLGFHVWFSRQHGFTWYAVDDPERYVALSRAWVGREEP
ncbi:MAG: hypothetical protein AAF602_00465 [Myxococcota bacterium]